MYFAIYLSCDFKKHRIEEFCQKLNLPIGAIRQQNMKFNRIDIY
jgi:hypothetical protein